MDPFGQNDDLNDDFDVSNNKDKSLAFLPKRKSTLICVFIIILGVTIGTLVLIFFLLNKNNSSTSSISNDKPKSGGDTNKLSGIGGEINCKYSIANANIDAPLLSRNFENLNNTIVSIEINEKKINYTKEYKFSSVGTYKVKFILNSIVNMDNMFRDLKNIISVESMNAYKNSTLKIISAISAFQECPNLKEVTINDDSFDTSELKSTSKMFYNSGLNKINLNNFNARNVENMSFMFGSCESLTSLSLEKFDTSNVKDMSYMFSNCKSLTSLKLNFNTQNV